MTEQTQFDLFKGRQARDEGMARAEDHAPDDWRQFTYSLIEEIARSRAEFTCDEIERLRAERGGPVTHERRAVGPLMLRAAKAGLCERTDRYQPSTQVINHGCPRVIWRSLVR